MEESLWLHSNNMWLLLTIAVLGCGISLHGWRLLLQLNKKWNRKLWPEWQSGPLSQKIFVFLKRFVLQVIVTFVALGFGALGILALGDLLGLY